MRADRIPPLRVEAAWDRKVATVTVTGELDLNTAPDLTERLLEIAAARPEKLVLDLRSVAFLDLSGARAIARVRDALRDECPVIVRRLRPSARKVMDLSGMLPPEPSGPGPSA